MKIINRLLLIALILMSSATIISAQYDLFLKYKPNVSLQEIDSKIKDKKPIELDLSDNIELVNIKSLYKLDLNKNIDINRIIKITFRTIEERNLFIQGASTDPTIAYLQLPNVYKVDLVPNDSLYDQQWGMQNIQAEEAWEVTQGSGEVLIGLIDTGIDYLHPDLKDQIFVNSVEDLNGNGILDEGDINNIDDDGNGFVDDVIGWDFTDRVGFPFDPNGGDYLGWDNDPYDEQGHGTYVAGISSAKTNNIAGVAGIAPRSKIMNLRAFDPSGYGEEDDVAAAILYALDMGVDVLNMSFGDNAFSYVLKDVIAYAYSQGMVLIASAGNSGSQLPHYPSGYSEVICVGASSQNDFVAPFSNTGSTIDLVAPGTAVLTTSRDARYAFVNGTSASAPFVSGAAALLLSISDFDNEEIKQILKTTTDDIASSGWDEQSGAGRLNLRRALQINAPSIIKFDFPRQDYATSGNSIDIYASLLSANFVAYDLDYGIGLNPETWTNLISNGQYQFINEKIYTLNVSGLQDSAYTLRLLVYLSNGRTMEERINFHIDRSPPVADLINLGPAYYGEKSTIFASIYTNEYAVVRMYFREIISADFRYITLDGFATNNQFVKQTHYGFIPKDLAAQNIRYEIYFEVENLVGLKTLIKDNGNNFLINTDDFFQTASAEKLDYTLTPGRLYQDPVSVMTVDNSEILINKTVSPRWLHIYELIGDEFVEIDSLYERIPKSFGDFNQNLKADILSLFVRNGYIDEQEFEFSSVFATQFSDSSDAFWPILAQDIDDDGATEILVIEDDETIAVYEVGSTLGVTLEETFDNYSDEGFFGNSFETPIGTLADANADGIKEFWILDSDGDIISYEILGPDSYREGQFYKTDFIGSRGNIASGDYNGDNKDDLAVLLQSSEELDIAPFYLLLVFNLNGNNFNLLYQRAFIDPSSEFRTGFQNAESAIRFGNIDNDPQDELIVFAFPYSYIMKLENNTLNNIIYYKENVNSSQIFIGDLNHNGINEIALPTDKIIEFYEFDVSGKARVPSGLAGYSIDSANIYISWNGSADKYYIYKGTSAENMTLIDSSGDLGYVDPTVMNNNYYYYSVQAFDPSKPDPFSAMSEITEVYAHQPASILSLNSDTPRSISVVFDGKIKNTIENLESFIVENHGSPRSITASSQYSYLLSFDDPLPAGNHKLTVGKMRDFYDSPILPDTASFTVNTITEEEKFFITSYEMIDNYSVRISFNLDVDPLSAQNSGNYEFSPDNSLREISVSNGSPDQILIRTNNPLGSVGREYSLKLSNIYSSESTGSVKIGDGAGSFIVLTSFAENLNDVFVYPNPVRFGEGHNTLTFANLTRRAEITIFTLEGKKVITLLEEDGNGGISWDLRDESGEIVPSGIYVYLIRALDEFNNETEDKLEKFAILR